MPTNPPPSPTALPAIPTAEPGPAENGKDNLPLKPPPSVLPPGTYPIIGPEIATYGVLQPLAREAGIAILGTLHERRGNALGPGDPADDASGWVHAVWGRTFAQEIDDHYLAFADPRASGSLFGEQFGVDLWRSRRQDGRRDTVGVYVAHVNASADVDGLVTNGSATGYAQTQTGTASLDTNAAGLYWIHYGSGGWYVDSVLQSTWYDARATTLDTDLTTPGHGFVASVETGDPLHGSGRFSLEPQLQLVWQHVAFDDTNDGLGAVDLGATSGAALRVGVRGEWTIAGAHAQLWQPYVRANVWWDWGGLAKTDFGSFGGAPLLMSTTRLEAAGGLTWRISQHDDLYAQGGYQFSVAPAGVHSAGARGDLGVRFHW